MKVLLCISMFFLPNIINTDHFSTWLNNGLIKITQESLVFRHIQAVGKKGDYLVKGEVKAARKFYYSVEDGHNEYITEKQYASKNGGGREPFKIHIQIPNKQLPDHASLIMNLYERSKDGKIINLYPVLLERFN